MSVSEEIKLARIKKGLTQEELGIQVGKTRQQITRIELGKSSPTLCTLVKILTALNIKIQIP